MFKSYPMISRFVVFVFVPLLVLAIGSYIYLRRSLPAADGRSIKAGVSQPSLAAEVTVTAVERLGVDAAIIFAEPPPDPRAYEHRAQESQRFDLSERSLISAQTNGLTTMSS